jgi:DNA-binding transcriptional MerR regulator
MAAFRIGNLARRAGTNVPTIRYYEAIGLLRRPNRQPSGQRSYAEEDVRRLIFIRRCRDFNLGIEQVRSLVALMEDRSRSCLDARDIARQHLTTLRAKLAELTRLERRIADFVTNCERSCVGGPGPDCVILKDLGKLPPGSASV